VGDLALGDLALGDFSYWAISPGGRFLLVGDFSCFPKNITFKDYKKTLSASNFFNFQTEPYNKSTTYFLVTSAITQELSIILATRLYP